MNSIRLALLFATADAHFYLSMSFLSLAAVSRLLTPHEIGLGVIGSAICAFWYRMREFTPVSSLILREDLTLDDVRSAFTISFCLNALLCLMLCAAAGVIAELYQQEELSVLVRILAIACFLDTFSAPIITLLRRNLKFGKVALINMSNAAVTSLGTLAFALGGFGYLSGALGWLAGAFTGCVLAMLLHTDLRLFRPLIKNCSATLRFGKYNGINVLLYGLYESLPYILVGKLISVGAAAAYSRSLTIVQLPDKLILSSVLAVALPAFATLVRNGHDVKRSYLVSVAHVTAIQWPALVIISILAYPVVSLLLGPQWYGVVPLIQIMSLGYVFSFFTTLNFPALLSLGGMREVLWSAVIAWPVSASIIGAAAYFGLTAVAFSIWLAIGFQAFISTYLVRRHISFTWKELASELGRSAAVTLWATAGALLVVCCLGCSFNLTMAGGFLTILGGVAGWCFGIYSTGHPMLNEVRMISESLRRMRNASEVIRETKLPSIKFRLVQTRYWPWIFARQWKHLSKGSWWNHYLFNPDRLK